MPALEYFVVAESISIDRDSNRISLFHVVEEEFCTDFPATIPQLVAVSGWRISAEDIGKDFQVMLKIHRPWEEKRPHYPEFPINFTAEGPRARVNHYVLRLRVQKPCELTFEVLLNGEHQASHVVTCRSLGERARE